MADYENVIKGMEICTNGNCSERNCPYDDGSYDFSECYSKLGKDVLELLKTWKPMVDRYIEWRIGVENPEPDDQPCPPMPKGEEK